MQLTEKNEMNLEHRFFYRLVNFLYMSSLILACVISIFISLPDGIIFGLISAAISYAFLSALREGLIYVAFGRKFTWDWLRKPYYFCKIKYSNATSRTCSHE